MKLSLEDQRLSEGVKIQDGRHDGGVNRMEIKTAEMLKGHIY